MSIPSAGAISVAIVVMSLAYVVYVSKAGVSDSLQIEAEVGRRETEDGAIEQGEPEQAWESEF